MKKKSTINKIIKKLGHRPLALLQSLDDKRLPSRVISEIYALMYQIYVTNQHLGRFYKYTHSCAAYELSISF